MPGTAEVYPPGFATTVRVAGLTDCLCGAHRSGSFRRCRHGRDQTAAAVAARRRLFRREGLSAIARRSAAGPRPRHPGAHRGGSDGARSGRARAVVAKHLPVAGGTPVAPGLARVLQRDRRRAGAGTGGSRERDRAGPRRPREQPGSRSNISRSAKPTPWRRSPRPSPDPPAYSLPFSSAARG